MSDKVKEAIDSKDSKVIHQVRGDNKGRITRCVKRLQNMFKLNDVTGTYDHESISKLELGEVEISLKETWKNIQDLHDSFQHTREVGVNATKEKEIENEQLDYIVEVENKYYEGIKLIEKHNLACEKSQKEAVLINEIGIKEAALIEGKESFEIAMKVVQTTLESDDADVQRTASIVKEEFVKNFQNLLSINKDLKSLEERTGTNNGKEDKKRDLTKEKEAASELSHKLDVLIGQNQFKENQSLINNSAAQLMNSTMNPSKSQDDKFVKFKKISPPKFSGLYRDFPKFKRNFNSIVAVEGRSDIEIGATLKESIPKKHEHLIDNLPVENHQEMMKILTKKFGSSRFIVDEIVSQIRGMKPVTTDKMFIEFVETIDRIHRDLVELDMEAEIATTNMVTEIERKLPNPIRIKWSDEFMEEDVERSSKEMFDAFMKFLLKTQRKVEFHSLDTKQSHSQNQNKSFTNSSYVCGTAAGHGGGDNRQVGDGGINKNKTKPIKPFFPCLACNVDGVTNLQSITHSMDTCDIWNGFSVKEKEKRVKCKKHPFAKNHTTESCPFSNITKCRICSGTCHHFLLCPRRKASTNSTITKTMTSKTNLLPVMVQTTFFKTPKGVGLGAMFDLCSTDHYITHKKA